MDITFHYFAVKTLARKAGFSEEEAQRIATYLEFIDDFNWSVYLDCKNIPEYIKNDVSYDLYVFSFLVHNKNFNPATTGFSGIVDMATLLLERMQRFTVSPFHFIPPSIAEIAKDTRTVPAVVGNGSIISSQVIKGEIWCRLRVTGKWLLCVWAWSCIPLQIPMHIRCFRATIAGLTM